MPTRTQRAEAKALAAKMVAETVETARQIAAARQPIPLQPSPLIPDFGPQYRNPAYFGGYRNAEDQRDFEAFDRQADAADRAALAQIGDGSGRKVAA